MAKKFKITFVIIALALTLALFSITFVSASWNYKISGFTHCDIGGNWGWREGQSVCPLGYARVIDINELAIRCPAGSSTHTDGGYNQGCYYADGVGGCDVSQADECCFLLCKKSVCDSIKWYLDADNDGYYSQTKDACSSPGTGWTTTVKQPGDCNDTNLNVNPGAIEICDGIDNNCNGQVDENNVCNQCTQNSQCSGSIILINNYCSGNNIMSNYSSPICILGTCGLNYSSVFNQTCSSACSNGICIQNPIVMPIVQILSPVNGQTYNFTNIALNVSANQVINSWNYSLNGNNNVTFNPNTTILASEGSNNIIVYGTNSNGTGYATVIFNVNTSNPNNNEVLLPQVNVISPHGNYSSNSVLVNINAKNYSSIWYTFDNGVTNYSYSSPHYSVSLANGTHEIIAYANNSIGNVTSNNSFFNINTSNSVIQFPVIFVYSPQNKTYNASLVMVNFTAISPNNISALWYFNGTINKTINFEQLNLTNGYYHFIFYANDTSNNINSTSVNFRVLKTNIINDTNSSDDSDDNYGNVDEIDDIPNNSLTEFGLYSDYNNNTDIIILGSNATIDTLNLKSQKAVTIWWILFPLMVLILILILIILLVLMNRD